MTLAELKSMTAIDIISRSMAMHPTLLLESLQDRMWQDSKYANTRESVAIKRAVMASFEATNRACDIVKSESVEAFESDMSAGIIALNIACKLQCLPGHIRTQAALMTWAQD